MRRSGGARRADDFPASAARLGVALVEARPEKLVHREHLLVALARVRLNGAQANRVQALSALVRQRVHQRLQRRIHRG